MSGIVTGPEPLGEVAASFTEILLSRFAATPNGKAYRFKDAAGEWQSLTWGETEKEATRLAAGLMALGQGPEDRVAIAAETSMDWILADLAVALSGGAVTTVYSSTGASDVAFILSDSDSQILFAQNQAQLDKVISERENIPDLRKVVLLEGEGDGDFSISMNDLRALGDAALAEDPDLVRKRAESVTSDQLATLIYTSGTTGKPKGVELIQGAWGYVAATMDAVGVLNEDDLQYLWLPLAHVFGSVLIVVQIKGGFETAVDGNVPKIMENLAVVKPTFMGAVPRIFEKVYAAIEAKAKAAGPEAEQGFAWGIATGTEYRAVVAAGEEPSAELAAKFAMADEKVLATIRGAMGGRIRFFISGSAPLSSEVASWFAAAGMPVLEGYGLTETAAIATLGRPGTLASGTVGPPSPGTEIKIADDGEILVRSAAVMRGYRNRPDANEEVFVGDGWFATGDIGEFDEFSRLKITDRKKDLFKTSGGKYVAPSSIESQFKGICGLASNMVVHANNRKFVSAIITLDPDAAAMWATAQGKATDLASLSVDPAMIATIQASVDELNERLNHWEKIQKFVILDRDFSIEAGELTPSLKIKRKVIEKANAELLDSLYA